MALVHLKQEEGWQLERAVIAIYTNPFFIQQEQRFIISLFREIDVANSIQYIDTEDLIRGIKNKEGY